MLTERDVYDLLDARGVLYRAYAHEAVFTVEAAEVLDLPHDGPEAPVPMKNLFLRDDKKRAYFLVSAPDHKRVDLRALQQRLGSRRLSFASPADLQRMLGLIPGAVTPFGILNDTGRKVTMVFDDELRNQWVDAHPLVNTATVQLSVDVLLELIQEHGNDVIWCNTGE